MTDVKFMIFLVAVFGLFYAAESCKPYRRYVLPTGKLVECKNYKEIVKGVIRLSDCKDEITYLITGTVEVE